MAHVRPAPTETEEIIMPLVKVSDLLCHATEHHYGVAAINTFNFETVKWAIQAAELEKSPIIVQLYPGYEFHVDPAYIAYMAKDLAQKASVPVGVHLDHSAGYDIAVKGIKNGFPSVMIDGSLLPFEENISVTARVAEAARVFGVDVEAELGHVGVGSNVDDITNADRYTDPAQAAEFIKRTGCGSLAVAVGNAHGPYAQQPALDFERIKTLRAIATVPLVMHGSSGIPDDQMQRAVSLGMSKFNIATEYFRAVAAAMQDSFANGENDAANLFFKLGDRVTDFVRGKIRLLNPNEISL